MELLESVKLHLRVDGVDSDPILLELIETAKEYIFETTGKEYKSSEIENLCIKLLVEHWYDGTDRDVPHGIQSMLTHIEYKL